MQIVFTKHAERRIRFRGICRKDVMCAVRYPDKTIKKLGKYYFQKKLENGSIEICCEKTENNLKIVTVYWI